MRYTAIVWDTRDIKAEYPDSTLGTYETREQAETAIVEYLKTQHGSYIYKFHVEESA
jgi:hypothetical protein